MLGAGAASVEGAMGSTYEDLLQRLDLLEHKVANLQAADIMFRDLLSSFIRKAEEARQELVGFREEVESVRGHIK